MTDEDELMDRETYSRVKALLMREYGRRNIMFSDEELTIFIKYYDVDVKVEIMYGTINTNVYLKDECDYARFPTDGSGYSLEDLSKHTLMAPGAYLNTDGTHYVPNYCFTFSVDDIDHGDFIVRVIDRLVSQSKFNSDFFKSSLAGEFDADAEDDDQDAIELIDGCMPGDQSLDE